ncbi:unnamed protein product [Tilletia laevis]|nr:hypothetical protein CF335_g6086 [Tilletia laevis]CAD6889617.1 unnamed protein product [Tilletia caries]CAD6922521.1 unnamed protein product [Tilletia laevis]CAD6962188.1 unnamed protein product [Tilletia caries]
MAGKTMVTRDQALAWLRVTVGDGAGGLGPNPTFLLKRHEAILARARLAYAQEQQHQARQERRVEDEGGVIQACSSRWAQSIEAAREEVRDVSSDTDGTQPESTGSPEPVPPRLDESAREDLPLSPSLPSPGRSFSRQPAKTAIRTQTQNVTSECSSSRRNSPAQASAARTEHGLRVRPFAMLQQETQDITDLSLSMSPRKLVPQPATTISAGSAIVSSLRTNPPPQPSMMYKKGRVVKFDMPPVQTTDRNEFSAATDVTTPPDTASVTALPGNKARPTIRAFREELRGGGLSAEQSKSVDRKGKGKARDDFDEDAQEPHNSHAVMHFTPVLKTHAKRHATTSELIPARTRKVARAPVLPMAADSKKHVQPRAIEDETDFSEQERSILLLPLGEERIRRAKDLQWRRERRRLAAMREREREKERGMKVAALAVASNAERGQPIGKRLLEFSTVPAIPPANTRRIKRSALVPGLAVATSSRVTGDSAVATASSEAPTIPDGGGGGRATHHKKRRLALADTIMRSAGKGETDQHRTSRARGQQNRQLRSDSGNRDPSSSSRL